MAKPRIMHGMARETEEMAGWRPFRYVVALGVFASALAVSTVRAAQHRPPPKPVLSGTVQSIVDGDTLILRSGVQVRLVGIQAPKLPLGRRGFKAWPLAAEAKTALARLTSGMNLALSYTGRKSDRLQETGDRRIKRGRS